MIDVDYTKYIDYKVLLSSTEGISLRDFLISLTNAFSFTQMPQDPSMFYQQSSGTPRYKYAYILVA